MAVILETTQESLLFRQCFLANKLDQRARTIERRLRRFREQGMPKEEIAKMVKEWKQVWKDLDIHIFEFGCADCKKELYA